MVTVSNTDEQKSSEGVTALVNCHFLIIEAAVIICGLEAIVAVSYSHLKAAQRVSSHSRETLRELLPDLNS